MIENSKTNKKFTALNMARIAVCTALLCVLSPLAVPMPFPVPLTLQVLAVMLTALILSPLQALTAQLLYTLLGVVGLPVFSGGKGGFAALASPTGGFILGFILASFLVSLLKGSFESKYAIFRYAAAAVAVGIPSVYIPGILWFSAVQQIDLITSAKLVAASFILFDIGKCIAAAFIAYPVNSALKKIK